MSRRWFSSHTGFLLGSSLEAAHAVLCLVEVLHGLGGVGEDLGAGAVGSKAPLLAGLGRIPLILLRQVASLLLELLAGGNLILFGVLGQAVREGPHRYVQPIVLVGGPGQAEHVQVVA